MSTKLSNNTKSRRMRRVRAKISGTSEKPRLAVFRSNRGTSAQLIDDGNSRTLAAASSRELKSAHKVKKMNQAEQVGELIAKRALEKGITRAVLDRRSYRYHGRVRALAEGARKAGLAL